MLMPEWAFASSLVAIADENGVYPFGKDMVLPGTGLQVWPA